MTKAGVVPDGAYYSRRSSDKKGKPPPVSRPRTAERRADMKCIGGTWYYKGRAYSSLYEALVANWPKK